MNTEDIKKWMEEKGFDNSALAIDSNHRVSLYLSDVLGEFEESRVKNLTIKRVIACSNPCKIVGKQCKECRDRMVSEYLAENRL